jgi:hypothetical protein
VDTDIPNAARVYDYYLGGGHNFRADRDFAKRIIQVVPEVEQAARLNRAFLHRAVRYLADQGITQFLDLGSGIPTVGHVHDIAAAANPDSRVVYVDQEPVAVAHAELILRDVRTAEVLGADLRDVESVLGSEPVRRLLDLSRPVAVLMVAVLHFVPGDVAPIVRRYVDAVAPGSALVISHATPDPDPERFGRAIGLYRNASTPFVVRERDEIAGLLAGTDLVDPGLVWTPLWRPEPGAEAADAERAAFYAAVGRVRPATP